ncbi:EexN family lipoprotein [Halomonas sp. I1]|uniref:EexN family lipoprotein n=1 Tax=Halomonas sp. I1 TaxID=393536 RepID=UPI0028DE5AD5|nr:EexN family lipoprotein [Halomonas sp. I1]MDT8893743.1 EexN family lipoprotein [Halomonas sp. I1]
MIKRVSIVLCAVALAGCEAEAKNVDFYMENPQERESVLEECKKDIAEAMEDDNCINANAAANRVAEERRDDAWELESDLGAPNLGADKEE